MKCPTCGSADLVHRTADFAYTYKSETTVIPGVTGDYCPACTEAVLAMDESRRVLEAMLKFNSSVNKAIGPLAHLACPKCGTLDAAYPPEGPVTSNTLETGLLCSACGDASTEAGEFKRLMDAVTLDSSN